MALNPRVKRIVLLVLKIGIAVVLLGWLLRSGKLQPAEIGRAIRSSPLWLGVTFLLYNVCVILTANRWRMLLVSQGLRPTRRECIQMTYTGCFFSCFLPGGTGGDLVKAYYVSLDTHKRAEAITTVFLDRVFGLYCMVGFAAAAMLFRIGHLWGYASPPAAFGYTQTQLLAVGVLGAFGAATVGLVVFLSSHCRRLVHVLLDRLPQSLGSVLKRVYEAVYLYRGQRLVLLKFVLYSVTSHGLMAVALLLVGWSLNDPIAHGGARAFNYFFMIPLGIVVNGLPITPAGMGVFEWALDLLFGTVLAPGEPNMGVRVAFLAHILIILTNLVGLIFYVRGKRRVAEAVHEAAQGDGGPPLPEPVAHGQP